MDLGTGRVSTKPEIDGKFLEERTKSFKKFHSLLSLIEKNNTYFIKLLPRQQRSCTPSSYELVIPTLPPLQRFFC